MFLYLGLAIAASLGDPAVNTQISGCAPAQSSELSRLLDVELSSREPAPDVVVSIVCRPSEIHLVASDSTTTRERALDPATSPRTTALAAVELIEALADTPPLRTTQPPSVPSAPVKRRRFTLGASALMGLTHSPSSLTWGGVVAGEVTPFDGIPMLMAHLDVLADHTQRDLSRGKATVTSMTFGAAVGVKSNGPRWRTELGAGARGGPAWISGDARAAGTTAHSASSMWFGPMLRAGGEASLGEHLLLLAAVEAGTVTHSVGLLVDGRREASLNGAWLFASLGVGTTF